MKVIISSAGGVNWNNTRRIVVGSPTFCEGRGDFGIGNEYQAECPGCGRTLPTALMHLDHILDQAHHTAKLLSAGTILELLGPNTPHRPSQNYMGTINGFTASIHSIATPSKRVRSKNAGVKRGEIKTVLKTKQIWQNDIANLQYLCMCCNTAKRDRGMDALFGATRKSKSLTDYLPGLRDAGSKRKFGDD